MLENLILKELVDRVCIYIYIYIVRVFLRGDRKWRIETGAKDGTKIQNCRGRTGSRTEEETLYHRGALVGTIRLLLERRTPIERKINIYIMARDL